METQPSKKPNPNVRVFTYGQSHGKSSSVFRPFGKAFTLGVSHINFDEIKHLLSDKPLRRPDRKPSS